MASPLKLQDIKYLVFTKSQNVTKVSVHTRRRTLESEPSDDYLAYYIYVDLEIRSYLDTIRGKYPTYARLWFVLIDCRRVALDGVIPSDEHSENEGARVVQDATAQHGTTTSPR